MGTEEREPRRVWRPLPVCEDCWNRRNPGRQAVRVIGGPVQECIDCEEPTQSGIFVRMEVVWP